MYWPLWAICAIVMLIVLIILIAVRANFNSVAGGGPVSNRFRVMAESYIGLIDKGTAVEARFDMPPYNEMTKGTYIKIIRGRPKDESEKILAIKNKEELSKFDFKYKGHSHISDGMITNVQRYKSIDELIEKEGHVNVYPLTTSKKEAVAKFNAFLERLEPEKRAEREKCGVLAFHIKLNSNTADKVNKASRMLSLKANDHYDDNVIIDLIG